MRRITFDGLFCDIAKCDSTPGGTFCETGMCSQRKTWERLKEYEDAEEAGRLVVLPFQAVLASNAPVQPTDDPEWKQRVMRTFLGGR